MNRNRDFSLKVVIFAGIITSCVTIGYHITAGIQFDRECRGYLKRAADANSLEMADRELGRALGYLRMRGIDTEAGRNLGTFPDYTSIFYTSPDEQLSFFYDNLVASQNDVRSVIAKGDKATPTDTSNTLIKLRETLLDHSQNGESVTFPDGLDVYPYNARLLFLVIFPLIISALAGLAMIPSSSR